MRPLHNNPYSKYTAINQWLHERKNELDYWDDNLHKAEVLADWWDLVFHKNLCVWTEIKNTLIRNTPHRLVGQVIERIGEDQVQLLLKASEAAPRPRWDKAKRAKPDTYKWDYEFETWTVKDEEDKDLYLCPDCGRFFRAENICECTDGIRRCEYCTEDWEVCHECGRRIRWEERWAVDEYGDDVAFCDDCYEENTYYCDRCERTVTASNFDTESDLCTECLERANFERKVFVNTGKGGLVEICGWMRTNPRIPLIGVEIEVYAFSSFPDCNIAIGKVQKQYQRGAIMAAHDGSLSSYGKEFRICPATPEYWEKEGKEYITPFFDIIKKHGATKNSGAGMHVHIDERAFKEDLALYNFCRFFHDQKYFTLAFSGREDPEGVLRWATPWSHWDRDLSRWEETLEDWSERERYAAVNLERTHNTIEVRIFGTTTDPDEFIGRINAVWSLVELAQKATKPMTISPVNLARYMQKHDRPGFEIVEDAILRADDYKYL